MNFIDKLTIKKILLVQIVVVLVYGIISCAIFAESSSKECAKLDNVAIMQEKNKKDIEELANQILLISANQAELITLKDDVEEIKDNQIAVKLIELDAEMAALDSIEDREKWFLEYKDIIERYEEYVGAPITIYDVYTEDEIYLLERMVQTEIGSGSFEAKVHVADVVWNRLENEKWPDTITRIITSPNQFAYGASVISESTKLAVEYSFMFPDETGGALAFHSMGKSDTFGNYVFVMEDGYHFFYTEYHEP